jgi:2-polyprenyl-3-methyl-5-hydroxy-6-metoxy-1,4-benzoquinol methylase
MQYVRTFLDALSAEAEILDAGCGEGALVEEYATKGYHIKGIDLNYASDFVTQADVLNIPFCDKSFDVVLLLDVFEHLSFLEQPTVLKEIHRVLKRDGYLLLSVPNLSHLASRIQFSVFGRFTRTDIEENHIGERPIYENKTLIKANGFAIEKQIGFTLTVPVVYTQIICKNPTTLMWLHNLLDHFAIPSLAMLNFFTCKKVELMEEV